MAYPSKISAILTRLRSAGQLNGNATGSDANFSCGSFVRFCLSIDTTERRVANTTFSSNGCGYMIAACETFSEAVSGKRLSELHGLDDKELFDLMAASLGEIEKARGSCVQATANALRNAFADFRSGQIEDFRGEEALICTCFGVTEEQIADSITDGDLQTVDQVSDATNAGSGCGSCRMLIQEILDG